MKRYYTAACFLLLASSCNLQPAYERPDMNLDTEYRFAPEETLEYVNLPWWEQFDDPVLNDLIKTALKNNQNIQTATATVMQFYAQYQVAFSQILPQVSAQNSDQRIKWNSQIPPVNYLYQLFVNLSYELDLWGSIRNAIETSQATYLAQIDVRLNVILSIVSALAKAYITLLQYDNQLLIAKGTLISREKAMRIAESRYKAKVISLMDLKQAVAQYEDAEAQVTIYRGLIPVQEDLIRVLLGAQPGPVPRGKLLEELKLPATIPAGLPSDLLENRPDILQAEANLIAANALIGTARASFFPQFQLTGSAGKQSVVLDYLLKNISNYSEWQLNITEPLYTGGALTGTLHEAEAIFEQYYHIYQETVLSALQQVSDALVNFQTAKDTLVIQLEEVESYKIYRRLAGLRYFNGLNDYLTVTIADEDLFTIQLVAEATRAQIFSSLIDVYTALGQGWDVEADYCDKCDNPNPLWKALFF